MEQNKDITLPSSVLWNDLQFQMERLPEHLRSKFLLVLAVSERAKQLVLDPERHQVLGDENLVTRAFQEIAEGRFKVRVKDERLLRALQGQPEDTDIFPYRP